MTARRRWVAAALLLALAGGLTTLATWWHWSACRPDLSAPRCRVVRDETYALPLWSGLAHPSAASFAAAATAATLLGLAWLVVTGWARGSALRTVMAAVVATQPLLVAVSMAPPGWAPASVQGWLTWPAEVLVLPLLLGAGWLMDEPVLPTLRLILLGWGVTSFGPLHAFTDYAASMLAFAARTPRPPVLGYPTGVIQVVLGLTVLAITVRLGRPGSGGDDGEEGDEDDEPGRDGFTLAA